MHSWKQFSRLISFFFFFFAMLAVIRYCMLSLLSRKVLRYIINFFWERILAHKFLIVVSTELKSARLEEHCISRYRFLEAMSVGIDYVVGVVVCVNEYLSLERKHIYNTSLWRDVIWITTTGFVFVIIKDLGRNKFIFLIPVSNGSEWG